jgi:hypothetical protein
MKLKKIFLTLAAVVITIATFGQTSETINCRIWKTKSFCTIPQSANLPGRVNFSHTLVKTVSCSELDKKKNLVGVWVTFKGKNASELKMTSFYKNISLICKDTKDTLHPIAYLDMSQSNGRELIYTSNESTFGECIFKLKPKKKYDLFVIFSAGQVGDKLIIDNFLEAEIKE